MKGFPLGHLRVRRAGWHTAPQGELRAECGPAQLGIRRRGPGCALGGKAGGEGQDMPTEWEPRGVSSREDRGACHRGTAGPHGGCGGLGQPSGGGEAWRLWEGWLFPGAWPSETAKGVVGSGGRAFPSPPLPSRPLPSRPLPSLSSLPPFLPCSAL